MAEYSITQVKKRLDRLEVVYDDQASKTELNTILNQHDKLVYALDGDYRVNGLGMISGTITEKVYNYLIAQNGVWKSRVTERRKSDDR